MNGGLSRLMNAPPWLQRVAALALLAAVVLAAAGTVMAMAGMVAAKQEELRSERERAGRLARIVSFGRELPANDAMAETTGAEALFMEAESPSIARANLQTRVAAVARGHKVQLVSAGSLPDSEQNGYRLIGLRVDMAGAFETVHGTVLKLESSMPPLFIREMTIQRVNQPPSAKPGPTMLTAQLKIFAAYRLVDPLKRAATARAEIAR